MPRIKTKDMRRKRKVRRPRVLTFKFRVIPLVRMPRSVMFKKLDDFMRTGHMADDLELVASDFGRSQGFHVQPGKTWDVDSVDMQALRGLYEAFKSASQVRFEKVD